MGFSINMVMKQKSPLCTIFFLKACLSAIGPAVSHKLSWREEPASEPPQPSPHQRPFRDPTPFIVSNIPCSESISAHDCTNQIINIAFALLQGLKRIFSQVTGHRPEFQVLCRTSCACVHRFSASPFSSNPRTTQ